MQTTKSSCSNRSGLSDVPQRASPATPRSSRVSRTGDHDSNSATPTKISTDKSSKVIERRSPRSPATEKRRPSRLSELEVQVSQLQGDLKKTKDQLSLSEKLKKQAEDETEEAKKQLETMTAKLEDSQRQFVEFSSAEEARLHEFQQISQERDHAWQSELEALLLQHSADSAALCSSINETQKLKLQLDMVLTSEATEMKKSEDTKLELQDLKQTMEQALATIHNLKIEIQDCRRTEAEACDVASETQQQLESAKAVIEALNDECVQLRESLCSNETKLEEYRCKISHLEEMVKSINATKITEDVDRKIVVEATGANSPGVELKSMLETAEIKFQEVQDQCTMQIQAAYELVERVKIEYNAKEAVLEQTLLNVQSEIMQLKTNLVNKEAELHRLSAIINTQLNKENQIGHENQMKLESELMRSVNDAAEVKANLRDKETELQTIIKENKVLKSQIEEIEIENRKNYEVVVAELNLAKSKEQDLMLQLGCVTKEAEKSSKRATRMAEQLDASQAVSLEMEAELKRLRIQSDQWRKAAEAAAAVLTTSNAGRFVERTGSLNSDYNSVTDKLMSLPFSDDLDDESSKKKNTNVLKKIGGLWKKSSK